MKLISLSPDERINLIRLEKQVSDKKTAIRIRVILALDNGYSIKEVAEILLLNEDTITGIKKKYDKRQFFSDWLSDAYKGYDGKLTTEQELEVEKFVVDETVTDSLQVVDFIRKRYGIGYTVAGVTKLLHRMNFVYKQVCLIPGKLNEENQQKFLEDFKALKEKKSDSEVILFGDGVHPTHNPHKTKAWIKRGEEKQIKTNTGRGRLNINGVLNMETMKVTTHFSETINAEKTIKLFDKIHLVYKDATTIYLIIDNARYYKNKDVTAYLERKDCRIKVIHLPAYSPNLNFIERLWKFMKKYIIGVKYREKFKEFDYDIHQFFDNIEKYEFRLRQFIGTDLHLVKLTA